MPIPTAMTTVRMITRTGILGTRDISMIGNCRWTATSRASLCGRCGRAGRQGQDDLDRIMDEWQHAVGVARAH